MGVTVESALVSVNARRDLRALAGVTGWRQQREGFEPETVSLSLF
jgi:hypothetical protein